MTRKHFEALAAALKDSKPIVKPSADTPNWDRYREALAQWRADVRAIAEVIQAHSPRFQGIEGRNPWRADSRFYAACGYETVVQSLF